MTATPDAPIAAGTHHAPQGTGRVVDVLLAGHQPAQVVGEEKQAEEDQGESDAGGQGAHGAGPLAAILVQEEEPGEQAEKHGQKEENDDNLEEHGRHPLR